MTRVFIMDDHFLVREGLKKILEGEKGITVVGEAGDPEKLLSSLDEKACDVVILDISMPAKNGLELIGEIYKKHPHIKILILSMHPEERFALRAIKAGAYGYITKESSAEELLQAVRRVASGRRYVSQNFAEMLAMNAERREKLINYRTIHFNMRVATRIQRFY